MKARITLKNYNDKIKVNQGEILITDTRIALEFSFLGIKLSGDNYSDISETIIRI